MKKNARKNRIHSTAFGKGVPGKGGASTNYDATKSNLECFKEIQRAFKRTEGKQC